MLGAASLVSSVICVALLPLSRPAAYGTFLLTVGIAAISVSLGAKRVIRALFGNGFDEAGIRCGRGWVFSAMAVLGVPFLTLTGLTLLAGDIRDIWSFPIWRW
jgi:hypothetical protein